jgi:hypothetical protein
VTDLPLTTEEVRHDYSVYVDWLYLDRCEEFDRWLAAHDAEILRTAALDVYALSEQMQVRADLIEEGP